MDQTFITISTIAIVIGFYVGWTFRNKRINALEQHVSKYKNKLLKAEMELSNLEAYFKHLNIREPKIHEIKGKKQRRKAN